MCRSPSRNRCTAASVRRACRSRAPWSAVGSARSRTAARRSAWSSVTAAATGVRISVSTCWTRLIRAMSWAVLTVAKAQRARSDTTGTMSSETIFARTVAGRSRNRGRGRSPLARVAGEWGCWARSSAGSSAGGPAWARRPRAGGAGNLGAAASGFLRGVRMGSSFRAVPTGAVGRQGGWGGGCSGGAGGAGVVTRWPRGEGVTAGARRCTAVRCRGFGIGAAGGPPGLAGRRPAVRQWAVTVRSPTCRAEAEAARSSTVGESATKAAVMNR